MNRILRRLRRLSIDTRANVAIITALCAVPLIGMIGLSVDYAVLLSNKNKLDAAADAAAVAAATTAKTVINGGGTVAAAITAGQAQGMAAFAANGGGVAFSTSSSPVTPNISINPVGSQTLNIKVTYSMNSTSQFGKLFNRTSSTISGSSSSSTVLVPYYQFIFVVDVSGSMAIGGTATDINGLVSDPNIGCAFACHDPLHNRGSDYYAIAHNDGWKLKIDFVNTAIQNFITTLNTKIQGIPGVFSVGIDTFGTTFTPFLYPTTNLIGPPTPSALSLAQTIQVENMQPLSVSQGYTRTTTSLQAALANVTNIGTGDGSSPANQATYFIFLSDGVEDIEGNLIYGRGTDVSYTSACSTMKANHATVISIEAPYPVIYNDQQYPILVGPLAPPATPNYTSAMQSCASATSWAYQATDGPGINTAVQQALSQILHGVTRITN